LFQLPTQTQELLLCLAKMETYQQSKLSYSLLLYQLE
jgi:hypothetical protein